MYLLTIEGYLNAYTGGSQTGCLIGAGTWYTTGTCATYTATASGKLDQVMEARSKLIYYDQGSGFTLKTSKGPCGISNSAFTCGSGVTATVFGVSSSCFHKLHILRPKKQASNNELAYNGNANFYAVAIPSGSTQQAVSTKAESVTVTFQWQGK